MGIKLDWEIEAEQAQVRSEGEDPEAIRRRRQARFRLLLMILFIIALGVGAYAGVQWRLRQVDQQIEQMLVDTVDAEVAAIRIGDKAAFLGVQRSATEDWLIAQEASFDHYQTLKLDSDVTLTGRVVETTVDKLRGRVVVEEILGGIPFGRVWFYWRYDDGWRHVPPDYTFWGDVKTIDAERVSVRYQSVDASVASAISSELAEWLTTGCAALACQNLPKVMIEIVPDETLQIGWSPASPWLLQIPSPYLKGARLDNPFDLDMQLQVANLIAERLVAQSANNVQAIYPADAYYLHEAAIAWLIGRFAHVNTDSFLVRSLAETYGDQAVGRLLQVMQPNADASVLNQVAGTFSLDEVRADWRDFLTWRLKIEDDLIAQRDETNFVLLYDTRDDAIRNIAYSRFNAGLPPEEKVVLSAQPENVGGMPQLRAQVQIGSGDAVRQEEVIFRLVDGVWRRAS